MMTKTELRKFYLAKNPFYQNKICLIILIGRFFKMGIQVSEILELSIAEKIRLVEEIWDSIAKNPESLPLTDEERAELDKRLQEYRENPTEGIAWNQLKMRLSRTK
jgi:putative addiction module component (TIGR02574 family)